MRWLSSRAAECSGCRRALQSAVVVVARCRVQWLSSRLLQNAMGFVAQLQNAMGLVAQLQNAMGFVAQLQSAMRIVAQLQNAMGIVFSVIFWPKSVWHPVSFLTSERERVALPCGPTTIGTTPGRRSPHSYAASVACQDETHASCGVTYRRHRGTLHHHRHHHHQPPPLYTDLQNAMVIHSTPPSRGRPSRCGGRWWWWWWRSWGVCPARRHHRL